jgi:hypothetical protein
MPFSDLETEERMRVQDPKRYRREKALQQWQNLFLEVPGEVPALGQYAYPPDRPTIPTRKLYPTTEGSRMPRAGGRQDPELRLRRYREWWPWLFTPGGPA